MPESLIPVQYEHLACQIKKRQKQLLNAMRWKANTRCDKQSASAIDPFKSMSQLMKDSAKWTRKLIRGGMHKTRPEYQLKEEAHGCSLQVDERSLGQPVPLTYTSGHNYSKDGKIKTFSIHIRETSLGMDFMWAHNAFGKQIMEPFDTFVCHIHANSTATSQGPSNMGKSSNPTVPQPLQSSIKSANMSTAAHPTNGYFLETDISMNSDGPEYEEDVISVTGSNVSMFSQ
ncbi:hypothetical protein HD554DRAFT_2042127 [Boletus coccyginus]|nr:hypothetical protein HD554DRAFT_2042127 [Boletus coccyginus]